jgi:hypothetical protein
MQVPRSDVRLPGRQEDQRIDDEHQAVAAGKVGDARGDQGDGEPGVGEVPDRPGDARDQQRKHAEYLGDRQLDLEVVGQTQMDEGPLHRPKWVAQIEVDGAEHHHRADDARARPVDRIPCGCRLGHVLSLL